MCMNTPVRGKCGCSLMWGSKRPAGHVVSRRHPLVYPLSCVSGPRGGAVSGKEGRRGLRSGDGILPFMPLHPGATSTKGVPTIEWPHDFTFLAHLWDMPSATTAKLLGVKMVRNLLSPIVVRDGTPIGDVVDESQTVFGQLPADETYRATHSVTQLLFRLDAKIAQVQRPPVDGAVRPCPKPEPKPKPKPQAAGIPGSRFPTQRQP